MENEAIRSRRLFFGTVAAAVASVVVPKASPHIGVDMANGKDWTACDPEAFRRMMIEEVCRVYRVPRHLVVA